VNSQVKSINITSWRAKIVKLNGDYLFKKLTNAREELKQLDPNMQEKFQEFAKFYGMAVLGYAGQDLSIMGILDRIPTQDERYFENGIFWGIRRGSPPASRVADLAACFPGRFRLFQCDDFDIFMAKLHACRKLRLPKPILQPFEALRDRYTLLIRTETADTRSDLEIDADRRRLQNQLQLPWAKTNNEAQLDLLQAQLALGRREYETAIQHIRSTSTRSPAISMGSPLWLCACAARRRPAVGCDPAIRCGEVASGDCAGSETAAAESATGALRPGTIFQPKADAAASDCGVRSAARDGSGRPRGA
jgi:hypothetical protein